MKEKILEKINEYIATYNNGIQEKVKSQIKHSDLSNEGDRIDFEFLSRDILEDGRKFCFLVNFVLAHIEEEPKYCFDKVSGLIADRDMIDISDERYVMYGNLTL